MLQEMVQCLTETQARAAELFALLVSFNGTSPTESAPKLWLQLDNALPETTLSVSQRSTRGLQTDLRNETQSVAYEFHDTNIKTREARVISMSIRALSSNLYAIQNSCTMHPAPPLLRDKSGTIPA